MYSTLGYLQAMEHNKQLQHLEPGEMERLNTKCDQPVSGASQLWHYQLHHQHFSQEDLTGYIQAGYDEKTVEERWTFPAGCSSSPSS